MVGNVLADIGDGAVRTDDDFGVLIRTDIGKNFTSLLFLEFGRFASRPPHNVAAFVFTLSFKIKNTAIEHKSAGSIPEVEAEYLALARKKIVLNRQPQHRLEMAAKYCSGDKIGDGRGVVITRFKRMQ